MSEQERQVASCIPKPWYHWHRFALLPHVRVRPANDQNTVSVSFHWLVFRAWTMDSSDIGVEITLDDQQLLIRGQIPYLIFGLFIPLFPQSFHQKTWRKSAWYKRALRGSI